MRPQLVEADVVGPDSLVLTYADGLVARLALGAYLDRHPGPVTDPLRDPDEFASVSVEQGVLTWSTGFDVCPDVLRFWCEQGRVCSAEETEAHFHEQASGDAVRSS